MAFLIPEGVILGLEALGITAAAVGTAYVTYQAIEGHLNVLNAAKSVDDALLHIGTYVEDIVKAGITANDWLAVNLYSALEEAYRTGELLPSETVAAVKWVMVIDKKAILTADYLTTGQFAAALSLWAVHQGHTAHTATPAPVTPTAQVVYVGPVGVGTNTPGGVMVNQAEHGLAATRVTVPGMPATQAKGVTTALATSYANTVKVLVNVANSLSAQIDHVGTLAAAAQGAAVDAYKLAKANEAKLSNSIATLNADLTHDGNVINTLQSKVATLEQAVTDVTNTERTLAAEVAALPGTLPVVPPLPVTQTYPDITAIPGGKALTDTVAQQGTEILSLEGILAGVAAGTLAVTMEDLMRCCSANSAVTDPISAGGATPSLLGGLGSLLIKAAAIGIVLSWVDTLYAVLDLPAAIAADVKGAEWIAPIVASVVEVNFSDLSWAAPLKNTIAA